MNVDKRDRYCGSEFVRDKEMRLLHAIGILVLDLPDMSPKKEITTAYHRSH